jgi:hypothetical protein
VSLGEISGEYRMTKTLLLSGVVLFALSTTSFATVAPVEGKMGVSVKQDISDLEAKRRKPRQPGGSGCDSPEDQIEHPECATTPPPAG